MVPSIKIIRPDDVRHLVKGVVVQKQTAQHGLFAFNRLGGTPDGRHVFRRCCRLSRSVKRRARHRHGGRDRFFMRRHVSRNNDVGQIRFGNGCRIVRFTHGVNDVRGRQIPRLHYFDVIHEIAMKKDSVKKRSDCPTNLKTGTEFRLAFCEKTALAGESLPMAILNRNKPEFYCVPASLFKGLLQRPSPQIRKELGLCTFADCPAVQ